MMKYTLSGLSWCRQDQDTNTTIKKLFVLLIVVAFLFVQSPFPGMADVFTDAWKGIKNIGEKVVDVVTYPAKFIGDLGNKATGVESAIGDAKDAINKNIKTGGDQAIRVLNEFEASNARTIDLLSATYKDNLDVTIDSLDIASQRMLRNIEKSIDNVSRELNAMLQEDIVRVEQSSINVIKAASEETQKNLDQFEQSMKEVILTAGETTVYVVDRTTNNVMSIISIVMLGLGVLLFIYLFFIHKIPSGIAKTIVGIFIVSYLVGFGALLVSPDVRAYAMKSAQLGLRAELKKSDEPSILYVAPAAIEFGKTDKLGILGTNLAWHGQTPKITVGGQSVPIEESDDNHIIANLSTVNLSDVFTKNSKETIVLITYKENVTYDVVVNIAKTPTPTPTTSPTSQLPSNTGVVPPSSQSVLLPVLIKAVHSNKCLDVWGMSREDGANVQQYPCNGGNNQLFSLLPTGNGYYQIVAKHSGKCLDVWGSSKDDATNVQQYSCHGGNNQLFSLVPKGNGYYQIIAKHSGKCLDVWGSSKDDATNVQQYSCHGGNNQLWTFY